MSAAGDLRALHVPGDPLVLPNAWDAATARLVQEAGFPVVATTSSGVAEALGYADREVTPVEEMLAAVARIARAVAVPVTADLEGGYGLEPAELAERTGAAGAVGLNFEDTDHARFPALHPVDAQAGRIAALKGAGDLVVNARIDCAIRDGDLEEALARAAAYRDAGADCVYPIGVTDESQIARFVALEVPVNVLLSPEAPPVSRLRALGVARVSLGEYVYADAMDFVRERLLALRPGFGDAPAADASSSSS
jgi:2-methylisocitrate lyase-like PEP mutase family enzyme